MPEIQSHNLLLITALHPHSCFMPNGVFLGTIDKSSGGLSESHHSPHILCVPSNVVKATEDVLASLVTGTSVSKEVACWNWPG